MKKLVVLSILFCVLVVPFCMPSIADDEIKAEIASMKAEIADIKTEIAGIKTEIAVMKTEIKNLKENVNQGFESVHKNFEFIQRNFDRQNNIIIACIGLPLAIIAIVVTVWVVIENRRRKEFEEFKQEFKQEIKTLKQQLSAQ